MSVASGIPFFFLHKSQQLAQPPPPLFLSRSNSAFNLSTSLSPSSNRFRAPARSSKRASRSALTRRSISRNRCCNNCSRGAPPGDAEAGAGEGPGKTVTPADDALLENMDRRCCRSRASTPELEWCRTSAAGPATRSMGSFRRESSWAKA